MHKERESPVVQTGLRARTAGRGPSTSVAKSMLEGPLPAILGDSQVLRFLSLLWFPSIKRRRKIIGEGSDQRNPPRTPSLGTIFDNP